MPDAKRPISRKLRLCEIPIQWPILDRDDLGDDYYRDLIEAARRGETIASGNSDTVRDTRETI